LPNGIRQQLITQKQGRKERSGGKRKEGMREKEGLILALLFCTSSPASQGWKAELATAPGV